MTGLLIVLMFMSSAVTGIFFIIWLGSPRFWPGFAWIQLETIAISFAIMVALAILIALRNDKHFFKNWHFFGLGKLFK